MFWWGYNADDPHPLVAVTSSQRGNLGSAPPCMSRFFLISSGTITWNKHDGEPITRIKFINLHNKSRQKLRQQICRKALFASILSDPDQNQEWVGCVGTKWRLDKDKFWIIKFSSVLSSSPTSFWHLISVCQWSYNSLWSRHMCWIQHQLTTKLLRVERNISHIMRAKHFMGSFDDIWCLLS